MAGLLDSLREAGAEEQVAALLAATRRPRLPRRPGRRGLAAGQPAGGGRAGAGHRAAAPRSAAHVSLDNPGAVAGLLDSLREAGAQEQATALAAASAAHVSLDNPDAVARLLDSLREAGAQEQATALAEPRRRPRRPRRPGRRGQAAGQPAGGGRAGAGHRAGRRLPGAGMFELFREQEDRQDRFRFGREADGSPAGPWGWEDLD